MKICSKCGQTLSDEESTCPYCFAKNLDSTSNEGDALMNAVLYSAASDKEENEIEAALEAVDTELDDNYDFPEEPAEEEEKSAPEASPAENSAEEKSFVGEPRKKGFRDSGQGELEARVKDFVKLDGARDDSVVASRLGVSLVAIVVTAFLVLAVICLVRYMRAPTASEDQLLLEYISGSWLSEPFIYADDQTHGYVEVLEIKADGSFTMTHLIPDPRNEKGYLDGSWPMYSVLTGEIEVYVENQCLLFKYSEFGQDYYLDRYIVETDDDSLILREFYDDAMTESYDMVYSRISPAA